MRKFLLTDADNLAVIYGNLDAACLGLGEFTKVIRLLELAIED